MPRDPVAAWLTEFAVPPVLQSREEAVHWHERIGAALRDPPERRLPIEVLSQIRDRCAFYLAYHGVDVRPLLEEFAAFCRRSCPELSFDSSSTAEPRRTHARASGKLRIGFLSQYLYHHTVAALFAGVITNFDRERFQVVQLQFPNTTSRLVEAVMLFQVPSHVEALAKVARPIPDRAVTLPGSLQEARAAIAELELDVLFYLDIGMNSMTYFLAFSRLAPVQCTSWGHPVTSGLSTIDYFISSSAMEPPGAEAHYSEKLVLLENLPTFYYRPARPSPRERGDFGLGRRRVYLCPQSLFKLHVDFDGILLEILERDPGGEVVLVEGPSEKGAWQDSLARRFERSLGAHAGRVRFVPRQSSESFLQLLDVADVLLDPVHFGSGKTAYEGLAMGTPIVTWPGEFMRGRVTAACYAQMGLREPVADDVGEYARTAVDLATDADRRAALRANILETNDVLFENTAAVREIEERFLVAAFGERAG